MNAIYARQSVDKKDSISIETQIEHCKRELTDTCDYLVYSDKGYSGSNMRRPEFQRLLSDIRCGKISRVIIYRLDRVSRSTLDFATLIDLFDKHGVTFSSTQEKFDTSTPIGRAMLSITMVFAQLERETIRERICDNYYARGEKGMYLGGPAPYGFRKITVQTETGRLKLLERNPETAPVLERIYHMYGAELCSLGKIAKTLNAEGVASPNGKSKWDSGKITRVLRNPVSVMADAEVYRYYADRGCNITGNPSDFTLDKGIYLYGKREGHERKYTDVTNHVVSLAPHDGIIPSDLFLRCQERLDNNAQIDNRKRSEITWLTGLIKCGGCGHGIIPKSSNGGRYTYLYCTGRSTYHTCELEGNFGTLSAVEDVVANRIFDWAERYSDLKSHIDEASSRERNQLRAKIEEIRIELDKWIAAIPDSNEATLRHINMRVDDLEKRRKALEAQLDELRHDGNSSRHSREISDLRDSWENLGIHRKNRIASLLFSRIKLWQDAIELEWSYDFDIT